MASCDHNHTILNQSQHNSNGSSTYTTYQRTRTCLRQCYCAYLGEFFSIILRFAITFGERVPFCAPSSHFLRFLASDTTTCAMQSVEFTTGTKHASNFRHRPARLPPLSAAASAVAEAKKEWSITGGSLSATLAKNFRQAVAGYGRP